MSESRLTCPHCGEYERYQLMSVRDFKCVYWCKPCDRLHEWVRESVNDAWRVREEKE